LSGAAVLFGILALGEVIFETAFRTLFIKEGFNEGGEGPKPGGAESSESEASEGDGVAVGVAVGVEVGVDVCIFIGRDLLLALRPMN
jgi:hypothetical protein